MPLVKLDSGFNIEVEFAVAPFIKRLIAWIIDILICWLLTAGVSSLLRIPSFFVWPIDWGVRGVIAGLPTLFYFLISEITTNGKSIGKVAMNLKVITEDGGQPGIGQYLIRWVFRMIDFGWWIGLATVQGVLPWWCFPLMFAGVASIAYTDKSQRVGDIIAGTILIDLKKTASWEDTVFTELSDSYQPKYPQVMQLSDRDINTLKSIIDAAKKKNNYELAARIAERIKSRTGIQSDEYAIDFLERLMLDYNYYASR